MFLRTQTGPLLGLFILLATPCFSLAQDVAAPEEKEAAFEIPENEKPFWESAQRFVDAYAKRDATAIGELFTEDAEFLDELKVRTSGRAAIVARFEEAFAGSSGVLIDSIHIDGVRSLGDSVAIEEGTVIASASANQPRHHNRYVAIHHKSDDGVWRIAILKDFPREEMGRVEQLSQLSWMVGEWINEDSKSVVNTQCDWSEDGNYLLRRFTVQMNDGRQMSGTQRTGWDSVHKKLRSWTFDSEGGFFSGFWTRTDDGWILTSAGVSASGETVTSTAIYKIIDAEMLTWQYSNLIIGDDVRGGSEPVTMVRRPPSPSPFTGP